MIAYNVKVRCVLESTFGFLIGFPVELSQPPMQVGIVVADVLPVAIHDRDVRHVEADHRWEQSIPGQQRPPRNRGS